MCGLVVDAAARASTRYRRMACWPATVGETAACRRGPTFVVFVLQTRSVGDEMPLGLALNRAEQKRAARRQHVARRDEPVGPVAIFLASFDDGCASATRLM